MSKGFAALDPCVHCGFCLPACPTFLATGDEADSPRGRIVLMRALERGEIPPGDEALREHLDACLGCRGCEPVCPSGVEYGRGLETAREMLTARVGLGWKTRGVLALFRRRWLWAPLFSLARILRSSGIPGHLAGRSPVGFGMAMLAVTAPQTKSLSAHPALRRRPSGHLAARKSLEGRPSDLAARKSFEGSAPDRTVLLFRGCVMDQLFSHIHHATRRTLTANGYRVLETTLPACCGALHMHAGDRKSAAELAQTNVDGMIGGVDYIAVNSAGCGAVLKDYGDLLGTEHARVFAAKVRDVTQLLAQAGPKPGGKLSLVIAYDAPCHLQHAQRVHAEAIAVLAAIPGARIENLPGSDRCCGSAGIYSVLHPAMARAVLEAKIETIAQARPRPDVVATGNPGCLMQIGAGLLAAGLPIPVAHPVELLDRSYQRAGFYDSDK